VCTVRRYLIADAVPRHGYAAGAKGEWLAMEGFVSLLMLSRVLLTFNYALFTSAESSEYLRPSD
jgi:hypothetical protein